MNHQSKILVDYSQFWIRLNCASPGLSIHIDLVCICRLITVLNQCFRYHLVWINATQSKAIKVSFHGSGVLLDSICGCFDIGYWHLLSRLTFTRCCGTVLGYISRLCVQELPRVSFCMSDWQAESDILMRYSFQFVCSIYRFHRIVTCYSYHATEPRPVDSS